MTKITSINIHPHQLLKFIVNKFTLGKMAPGSGYSLFNIMIIEPHGTDQVFMREL